MAQTCEMRDIRTTRKRKERNLIQKEFSLAQDFAVAFPHLVMRLIFTDYLLKDFCWIVLSVSKNKVDLNSFV